MLGGETTIPRLVPGVLMLTATPAWPAVRAAMLLRAGGPWAALVSTGAAASKEIFRAPCVIPAISFRLDCFFTGGAAAVLPFAFSLCVCSTALFTGGYMVLGGGTSAAAAWAAWDFRC